MKLDPEETFNEIAKIKDPFLLELLQALKASGKTPNIEGSNEVSYGSYSPRSDTIKLNPLRGNNRATVAHELTHAVDQRMEDRANQTKPARPVDIGILNYLAGKKSYIDPLFHDAWTKLQPHKSNLPDIKKNVNNPGYRYSNAELRSHGVENMLGAVPGFAQRPAFNPVAPHIDATMATEASILMDLYLRSMRNKQK